MASVTCITHQIFYSYKSLINFSTPIEDNFPLNQKLHESIYGFENQELLKNVVYIFINVLQEQRGRNSKTAKEEMVETEI
ncbi:hypothetical protein BB560_003379 [Smittium megazygosporum]|uniref:Uncharacterized protein n=1 Tax=Smittium megazygosporum TaxID=133381 RepID=A0A2T9ZC49_9FUNG|nr:hypothetical protein BB560_003379 [Smittium megazygosporum]